MDLYKYAKKLLKEKNLGRDSKLEHHDIRDIILLAMVDGTLDSKEIRELEDIKRYHPENMTDDAGQVFINFMNGALGEYNKRDYDAEIISKKINKIMSEKEGAKILDLEDTKDLLFLAIRDGKLTQAKLDKLLKISKMIEYGRVSNDAVHFTSKFIKAYHNRLHPQGLPAEPPKNPVTIPKKMEKQVTTSTKVHDLAPQTYRQCGTCYGSGRTTCSSCYGMGGRSEDRVTYDYQGNPEYTSDWISCYGCSGGYSTCYGCGGSGSVYI